MNIKALNDQFLKEVMAGNRAGAAKLLEDGAELNAVSSLGNNALFLASSRNKKEMFNWLLEVSKEGKPIDLNHKNVNGYPLLFSLIKEGDKLEYIQSLLDHGADPNVLPVGEVSPLIRAVADGQLDVIKALLATGRVDVNYVVPKTKTTAFLMLSVAGDGPDSIEIAELLIKHGADINAENSDNKTALINAIFRTGEFLKKNEKIAHQELCKFLINQNLDVNHVAKTGLTPFWAAARSANREIAEMILDKGVNADVWHVIGTEEKKSALQMWMQMLEGDSGSIESMMAKMMGGAKQTKYTDEEFVEKMIASGAKMNQADALGNTPAAIGFLNPGMRETTLKLGGDVNAIFHQKDGNGKIAKIAVLSAIIKNGDANIELIQEMINKGALLNHKHDDELHKNEPILMALTASAPKIFEAILESGQIDSEFSIKVGKDDEIPLISWTVSGLVNEKIQQVLSEKKKLEILMKAKEENDKNGVKSDLINDEGFAQIQEKLNQLKDIESGLANNNKEMFDLLIKHGHDVKAKNTKGLTPLFFASTPMHMEWLLEVGANMFEKSNDGDDLFIHAIKNNKVEVIDFIKEKFIEHKNESVHDYFYQLAFSQPSNQMERSKIENGIIALLSNEEKELLNVRKNKNTEEEVVKEKPEVANINYTDADGNTPLLVACANDNAFLVNIYHKLGANVNIENDNGETPLMHAIGVGNAKMVEYLIDNGADVEAQTNDKKSVKEFAEESENKEIIEKVKIALGYNLQEGQISGLKKLKRM